MCICILHIFGEKNASTATYTLHLYTHAKNIDVARYSFVSSVAVLCKRHRSRARWSARYTGAIVINERRVFRGAPEGRNERAHGVYRHPNIHFPLPRSTVAGTAKAAAVINDFCARAFAAGADARVHTSVATLTVFLLNLPDPMLFVTALNAI